MKRIILMLIILTASTGVRSFAQQNTDDESAIRTVLKIYERSVINRDSVAFYDLFNNGPVEWAAGIKDRSQEKIIAKQGHEPIISPALIKVSAGDLQNEII